MLYWYDGRDVGDESPSLCFELAVATLNLMILGPSTRVVFFVPQLKNYEQAVIEKRFSELEDDEVDALLDEVNEQ